MTDNTSTPSANAHQGLGRRELLIGFTLAVGSALTWARKPRNRLDLVGDRKLEEIIPKKIGPWEFVTTSGLVVPTEDDLAAALYSQILTRVYADGVSPAVMLLIAQGSGQSGLLQIHRPEFCYPAGGFELSPISQRSLDVSSGGEIAVNQLTASLPGRSEQIIYWTRVGDSMPVSWAQQRLVIAADNLRGDIPDAVLTRISTIDSDREAAAERLTRFAEAMLGAMKEDEKILIATG